MTDDLDALEFDYDGYPTEETLAAITRWQPPFETLFDGLQDLWRWRAYFQRAERSRSGKRTYRVSTGGWSGHEDVIGAMQDNFILWALCWESSRKGGHYVFRVPVRVSA